MLKTIVALIFSAGVLGAGCMALRTLAEGDGADQGSRPAGVAAAHSDTARLDVAHPVLPHWSYDDENGWAGAGPDAAACLHGQRQSPIELSDARRVDEPDFEFRYRAVFAEERNNGHTLEIASPAGETVFAGGAELRLVQAHFHDPAEHVIGGARLPLEMHLVHRAADGALVVIGVLFREGGAHPGLAALWRDLPGLRENAPPLRVAFDPGAFLPDDQTHFEYSGSLTTPPCTEGVRWLVFQTPLEASRTQIDAFRAAFGENARMLKPRNGRDVSVGK